MTHALRTHPRPLLIPVAALLLAMPSVGQSLAPTTRAGLEWEVLTPGNTGIPGDYVHTIFIDRDDRPWIPAYIPFWEQGGMAHWDGERWFTVSNVDNPVIASPRFNDIVEDPSGILWIASDEGLLRYDPEVGPSSLARYDRTNTPMPRDHLTDLAVAPGGALWIAISDPQGGGGLARFDPATSAWNVWTTANGLPWGTSWPGWDNVDHVVVATDAEGMTVWFDSTLGVGTFRQGSFAWLGNNPPPAQTPVPTGFMSETPVDAQGNLWMMTGNGLARRAFDGSYLVTGFPAGLTTEVACVFALSGGRAALGTYYSDVFVYDGGWSYLGNWGGGSHTYALAEDSTGALWAGGIGGASKYENGSWQRHRLTNSGMLGYSLHTIDFDTAGNVYMNGNASPGVGGFTIFDGETWTCVDDANYGLGPAWGLPSDDVQALAVRANGHVALAPSGSQGVLEWDGNDYTYLVPQGYGVELLVEDGLGRLWAGRYGSGVFLIDGQSYVSFLATNSPLPAGSVGSLVVDRFQPGFVWIATQFGLAHTDGVSWTVYPRETLGLTLNSLGYHITCADQAADGTLWVGSGRGVFHFDPTTLDYTQYGLAGTALPSDDVWRIEITPDGTVWIATFDGAYPYPGGLTSFDGERWKTYHTGNSPLPHNQPGVLASRATADGWELWVGTAIGGVAVLKHGPGTTRWVAPGPRLAR